MSSPLGRLPIYFVLMATISFAAGSAAAPWAMLKLADYFYQTPVLAWVHTFTLGWISSTMIGLMLAYVPVLTQRRLRFPRLATAQLILYGIGASGVIAHFVLGSWDGVWMAGVVVAVSIVLFACNMVPCLAPGFGRRCAETGMLLGIGFMLAAAVLGVMLALDKSLDFLPGDVLLNLAGHVHVAAIGWIALPLCAISYHFAPRLLEAPAKLSRALNWHLYALGAGAVWLAASLFTDIEVTVAAGMVAALLAIYVALAAVSLGGSRVVMGWPARHVLAGLVGLALALAAGLALARYGAQSEMGNRLAGSYGILSLLGWVSNMMVGASYQLFPRLVLRARQSRRWPTMTAADLSPTAMRPAVFLGLNLGILGMVSGLLAGGTAVAEIGAVTLALAGLAYAAGNCWTLSFAYRRGG
jgi:cbb3-type cytochrome oxidase subunit 1